MSAFGGRSPGRKIVVAGLGVIAAGVLPLLLYIQFGPPDGNPIGLGLLAAVALPVGGILVVVGLVKLLADRVRSRR
jgi:hypothetical protein